MTNTYDANRAVFDANRKRLLAESPGKHVLIYDERIRGVYDSFIDAAYVGFENFGRVEMLIEEIAETDEMIILNRWWCADDYISRDPHAA